MVDFSFDTGDRVMMQQFSRYKFQTTVRHGVFINLSKDKLHAAVHWDGNKHPSVVWAVQLKPEVESLDE